MNMPPFGLQNATLAGIKSCSWAAADARNWLIFHDANDEHVHHSQKHEVVTSEVCAPPRRPGDRVIALPFAPRGPAGRRFLAVGSGSGAASSLPFAIGGRLD